MTDGPCLCIVAYTKDRQTERERKLNEEEELFKLKACCKQSPCER